jgi:glutaredoxin-related protein
METKTKYYTSEEISQKYAALSLKEKNEVLYEAIDYMQSYNGRSRFLCIAMAMGYDNYEGDNKSYFKRQ